MNIIGAKYCLDKDGMFSQENNAIEMLVPGLMYCFPTADINAIYSKYGREAVDIPLKGAGRNQPEDELTLFMINTNNWEDFRRIRGDVRYSMIHSPKQGLFHPTTIPQIHPYCIKMVLDIDCDFYWRWDKNISNALWFDYIAERVTSGDTFTMVEKNPGHAICIHGYSKENDCLVKKDPWISRFPDGSGFNKLITREVFNENYEDYVIHF